MKKINGVFIALTSLLLIRSSSLRAEDWRWLDRPFVEHYPVRPVDLTNSPRVRQLLRAGNIYLSLSDAVALAIENNLDIELQRYSQQIANFELQRAKGGGLLRGLS